MATRRTVKPVCKVEEIFTSQDDYGGEMNVYTGATARENLRKTLEETSDLDSYDINKITYDSVKGLISTTLGFEKAGVTFSDE